MRSGIKRLVSLLTTLMVVCSLVVMPAAGAGTDADLPIVTISENQTQTQYIFANSEYNSLDKMPELSGTIKGTYNGSTVELIPEWNKPNRLFNGLRGSTGNGSNGYFAPNTFTANTFTVKDTNERVQTDPNEAYPNAKRAVLNVWVIAVDANLRIDGYTDGKITVEKSQAQMVKTEEEMLNLLGLPVQAQVTYMPQQVNTGTVNLTEEAKKAHPFSQVDTTYNIVSWQMATYNLNLELPYFKNIAGEIGNTVPEKKVTLWANCDNPPEWATVQRGEMAYTLTFTQDPEAEITVNVTGKTYDGKPVTAATATATVKDSSEAVQNPTFTYRYAGVNFDGTKYGHSVPPTDAGEYEAEATLWTASNNRGSAAKKFTISKAESATAEAYISVPSGTEKTIKIDETFLPNSMAKGAKIKETPAITGDLVESCVATPGATEFTLRSKSDAPNGSAQQFDLVLESNNYETVTVKVTVQNDTVAITGAKLKGSTNSFSSGTALKDIVDLSGCSATVNGSPATGTFTLLEPNMVLNGPNTYTDWSVMVKFTTGGKEYRVRVSVPDFAIKATGTGSGTISDSYYLQNGYYLTIFANSEHNKDTSTLLKLVQDRKGSYTLGDRTYPANWTAAGGNPAFAPKGYANNIWYSYTAAVNGQTAKAYVRVVPVNSQSSGFTGASTKIVKAAELMALTEGNWKEALNLPSTVTFDHNPAEDVTNQDKADNFQDTDKTSAYTVTGWTMDGSLLTLAALKAKAAGISSDVTLTLTPAYSVPAWATVQGSAPTFKLTITPKTMVDVTWKGPNNKEITYGEKLNLDTPQQNSKDGGGTDPSGTWEYVYYKDGSKLSGKPTDAGTYKVQAILKSDTHSGASVLCEFTIKPKNINGCTVTPLTDINNLIFNKKPQTPEYTVMDGIATLTKGKDYTVTYSDNTNAGTAKVTFTGKGNYDSSTKEVTFTIQKCPLTGKQEPTISGNAAAGQVLSATLTDVDAEAVGWKWTVGGVEATGHTDFTYVVRPEDSNKTITVQAIAMESGNYSGESAVSVGKTVAKVTVTGTVTITATQTDGEGKISAGTELTATASVTPDAAKTGGAWSWKVNGEDKAGETSSTYTVAEGDKEIIAVFTPNDDYAGIIESAVIEVGKAPLSGNVKIDGDTGVGDELAASVTGGPTPAEGTSINYSYTWLRNGEPISDASGAKYTVAAADRGKILSVKVTAEGYTGELVSAGKEVSAGAPGTPKVTVTPGDKKLTISWSVEDDGGAPITCYNLNVMQASFSVLNVSLAADVTTYTLDQGLVNGAQCTVEVKVQNSIGRYSTASTIGTPTAPTPVNPNPGGGGGGGGGGKPSTGDPGTPDDKKTTVETLEDGTVVTTVTDSQGYVARTEERPDGSVLSTVHHVDGCNGTIETDTSGKTIAVVDVPAEVAGGAVDGNAVLLPVVGIRASKDIETAPALVVNTFGANGVKVRIPVENMGLTVVAVEIKSDGTPVIVKNTIPTENGIVLRMDHLEVIRFLDNRKAFVDAQDHWAADAIDFVSARELFNGTAPGTFSPNTEMTRGMMLTALARYADADTVGGTTWYEKGAAWAMANGLSDGTNLSNRITREQLTTIMYRYAALEGKLNGTGVELQGYADADYISSWAVDAMSWAVDVGLIKGTTSTTLNPQGGATRSQVAAIIMRYAEKFGL